MRIHYAAAKKLGEEAVRAAVKSGTSPYLPVLDALEEITNSSKEVRLGLLELPVNRIRGNKEMSRNNAFANNFMPILDEGTEFAIKWSELYDSYVKEGIRDAIKVYEYMNQYYVQEGNKRVSVSRFGGSDYILANVIRILPEKNDTKEVKVYYEYLDFYNVTKNFYIVLTEPGSYLHLAELLGQDLTHKWPEELCADLRAAYITFDKKCRSVLKVNDDFTMGDAFLVYISIFPMRTLFEDSDKQIIKNIKMARADLLVSSDIEHIAFLDTADGEEERNPGLLNLFGSNVKKYTSASPLRVAFVYDADIETSRWIDSHEAGRLYVDAMTEDNVTTASYYTQDHGGSVKKTLEKAVGDKNEIIFTVSPDMMADTLKVAVRNPDVKFLNCSLAQTHSSVRCYHGKLYEATFLMGVLAAQTLLLEPHDRSKRRIGYLSRVGGSMAIANLNAFAIGASMVDPDCRILLKCVAAGEAFDAGREWAAEGIRVYADIDYTVVPHSSGRAGVYKLEGDKAVFLGTPYFTWGKYYVQIVQSVLCGTWKAHDLINERMATNYWFGLSAGVVDVRAVSIPDQTRKLLAFLKNSIVNGGYDPFMGELNSQEQQIQEDTADRGFGVPLSMERLSPGKIAGMDWLNENIDGTMMI